MSCRRAVCEQRPQGHGQVRVHQHFIVFVLRNWVDATDAPMRVGERRYHASVAWHRDQQAATCVGAETARAHLQRAFQIYSLQQCGLQLVMVQRTHVIQMHDGVGNSGERCALAHPQHAAFNERFHRQISGAFVEGHGGDVGCVFERVGRQ